MSFFGKLKSKLFKSSSKLEEGLDAIVQEGGSEDAPEPSAPEPAAPPAPTPSAPEPTPSAPPAPADVPPPPAETPERPSETPPVAPDEAPSEAPEEAPAPVDPTPSPLPDPAETPEPGPDVTPPADPIPGPPSEIPSAPPLEMPAPLDPTPVAPPQETPTQTPSSARPGLLGRLFGRETPSAPVVRRVLDDDMLESLEELLIASDMGVDTALRVSANIAEGRYGKRVSTQEIKAALAAEVARVMDPVAKPLPLYPKKPQVVLVVGVNGSGKTTTIGKLASQFRAAGKSVVIAAGDTFRAAAVEQLQVWGDRAGVPVLTAPEGSDPASLAFDAMTKAQAEGADLLMIDTAGRLQNRQDLMEELAKIVRVIRKKDPDAPHNTLLVLDATTGQNALTQVEIFRQVADVSGLVMTKLDGTAKGGVLVALADKFGLPIHAIGVGEQIDDLAPFDPEEFAAALTGLEQG
ncbi:signal recognition particle-docking protein FtsY [Salipiger bermudensis]|uniref:Signal recognition particle receptor FtsY n=1 Tax=Salipiger bermudensis (strain DSM 26914 / JCM 13377 / KCTC 12554 / HTCC2601) TaxID=314265 RepID=Q0FT29_SALBH|nr:signal recognition particle-docking protein FtsY [Salipiger bermudensis]EAU47340.1 Signal recognition particle-docking protein FtsY [Salipiger bermudensis HTCC2601]MBR9893026.1 signal recognition particle-docking protein FtsY [bacterium]